MHPVYEQIARKIVDEHVDVPLKDETGEAMVRDIAIALEAVESAVAVRERASFLRVLEYSRSAIQISVDMCNDLIEHYQKSAGPPRDG